LSEFPISRAIDSTCVSLRIPKPKLLTQQIVDIIITTHMAFVGEKDCYQLANAGDVARAKGLLKPGKSLKCPQTGCDGINCTLLDEPLVRTIYVKSAQIPKQSPIDRFFHRLQEHKNMVAHK